MTATTPATNATAPNRGANSNNNWTKKSEFKGKVEGFNKLDSELNTFIGWNKVHFDDDNYKKKFLNNDSYLINSNYYFVHSCCVKNTNKEFVKGVSFNGNTSFVSLMMKDNVIATQFHPEKSGKVGIKLLENFLKPVF